MYDNQDYYNRFIAYGVCPQCNKLIAILSERNKATNIPANKIFTQHKAERILQQLNNQINYSRNDVYKKRNKVLFGWRYGVVVQDKNNTIREYAVDFAGNSQLIKEIIP